LAIHGGDLVAATFGRGFWILDNISPLRQIDDKVASSAAFLYKPAAAIRMNPEGFFGTPFPPEEPKAKNPPEGAMIDYFLKSAPSGEITLEILDARRQLVRRFSSQERAAVPPRPGAVADIWIAPPRRLTAVAGMNRFAWDLRYAAPGDDDAAPGEFDGAQQGPQVLPGTYQARLTVAGQSYAQTFQVALDPRSTATPAELQKQLDLCLSISRDMARAADALRQARALRSLLTERRSAAEAAGNAELASRIAALDTAAAAIMGNAGGGRGGRSGAVPASGSPNLASVSSLLGTALSVAGSADRTPPASAYEIGQQASRSLTALLASWKSLQDTRLAALNQDLRQNQLPAIVLGNAGK
jgi:hypothetical protein